MPKKACLRSRPASSKKGQVFSMDILSSVALFFFMLLTIFYFQALFVGRISLAESFAEREAKAEAVADSVYAALASSAVFSENATGEFFSRNYSDTDDAYRIYYNYTIQLQGTSGSVLSLGNTTLRIGSDPQGQAVVVSAYRLGVLNSSVARLVVGVW